MPMRPLFRSATLLLVGAVSAGVLAAVAVVPASGIDCYPPGSCEAGSVDYNVVKAELALGEGSTQVCEGAACTLVPAQRVVSATAVEFSVAGAVIRIAPLTAGGAPRQISASGDLVITSTAGVTVTLSGLKPGTWVDVYINSDRVLLGKVLVGASGSVSATLPLPAGIALGAHTVQVAGTSASGKVVSAALGVLVTPVALAAGAPRLVIVSARPGAAGFASARVGAVTRLKAGFAFALTGGRVGAASAAKLAPCSTVATVTTAAGKVLADRVCLVYSPATGKAYYDWAVPSGYVGKASVKFVFTEAGRKAAVRTQAFTIVK